MAYYAYDANGDRAKKVIENGNITEERIYIGDWEVYRKTVSGTLDTERETLHISDDLPTGQAGTGRIALIDTETTNSNNQNIRYQYSNHLGSASLELGDNAAIISYEEYHPFGSTSYRSGRNQTETSLKRYRYVGKERDEETGLYYYGARYYAAWLARFISTDPLKDEYPYYTSYQYAGNKPINNIDLDGLEPDPNTDTGGQKRTHTVQEGDTYWNLSRKYGVSVDQLRQWNGYSDTNIPIGAELSISPSLSNPRLIASSIRRPLTDPANPSQLRDDLVFGDMTNADIVQEGERYWINLNESDASSSDQELFRAFRRMSTDLFTSSEMTPVLEAMIDLFESNTGGSLGQNFTQDGQGYATFTNDRLNQAVQGSDEGQNFLNAIEGGIRGQLNQGIHPDKINLTGIARPMFNDFWEHTVRGGLTIAINDTQAFDVTLNELNINDDGSFSGTVTATIYDHFGLDRGDVTPGLFPLAGFRAWYRLQRERGYRPFVTRIDVSRSFSGRITP